MNEHKAIEAFESLKNLKEISIDGNPVSSKIEFKYQIIMRLPKLETLDEETIKELDRDVA